MENNLNDESEKSLIKGENNFLWEDKKSVQLRNSLPENQQKEELFAEFESSDDWERISTKPEKKGLSHLNKNLAQVAEKFANKPELNGLFITGLMANTLIQVGKPFLEKPLEQPLDKQAVGSALIKRLSDIVPDRFGGNSQEPFLWQDPELSGKTYQFEVEGGNLIQVEGKTQLTPKHLKAKEVNSGEQVFQASSLNNRNWHIEQCDFTASQLKGLIRAENLLQTREPVEEQCIAENRNTGDIPTISFEEIER